MSGRPGSKFLWILVMLGLELAFALSLVSLSTVTKQTLYVTFLIVGSDQPRLSQFAESRTPSVGSSNGSVSSASGLPALRSRRNSSGKTAPARYEPSGAL